MQSANQSLVRGHLLPPKFFFDRYAIDDAKRRRDCTACGAYCLRLLGSLER